MDRSWSWSRPSGASADARTRRLATRSARVRSGSEPRLAVLTEVRGRLAPPVVHPILDADERGQGLAEYALIVALIAIIAIGALIFLGGEISSILSTIGAAI